jgi:hypothetical protein
MRRLALATVLVLGGGVLSGCGDEPGLDTGEVEAFLLHSQQEVFSGRDVGPASCKDRALKEGMAVPCTLEVDGVEVPYRAVLHHVHSEDVDVDVALDGVVLLTDRLAPYVVQGLPDDFAAAEVTCEHSVVVAQVDDTFDCTVASGAQTRPITVTVLDDEGHVSLSSST